MKHLPLAAQYPFVLGTLISIELFLDLQMKINKICLTRSKDEAKRKILDVVFLKICMT